MGGGELRMSLNWENNNSWKTEAQIIFLYQPVFCFSLKL